jgi:hypothetical protein
MGITEEPWTCQDPAAKRLQLVLLRPENVASRRLLDQYGFRAVGEQWDEVDGQENILEVPLRG